MRLYSALPSSCLVLSALVLQAVADVAPINGSPCNCGFRDNSTGDVWTDSIIVYFNESTTIPPEGFNASRYVNNREKNWNSFYRRATTPDNLKIAAPVNTPSNISVANLSSLQFTVDPATKAHVVTGAELKSLRRDIQYGSFRTYMLGPRQKAGGTALSMIWKYNETQILEMDMANGETDDAWITYMAADEFPTRDLTGVNYTGLGNATFPHSKAWDWTELRMDWTKNETRFYVEGDLTRSITKKKMPKLPSVPGQMQFSHWSTGNKYLEEGPPLNNPSVGNIGYIRLFFNSSTWDKSNHTEFDQRCTDVSAICSTEDPALRGQSAYPIAAVKKWKQAKNKHGKRVAAIWISILCVGWTTFLILHALIKRAPWKKSKASAPAKKPSPAPAGSEPPSYNGTRPPSEQSDYPLANQGAKFGMFSEDATLAGSGWGTPNAAGSGWGTPNGYATPMHPFSPTRRSSITIYDDDEIRPSPLGSTAPSIKGRKTSFSTPPIRYNAAKSSPALASPSSPASPSNDKLYETGFSDVKLNDLPPPRRPNPFGDKSFPDTSMSTVALAERNVQKVPITQLPMAKGPAPKQRVDYLAGLVACCSIFVTVIHFCLTFLPAVIQPFMSAHYESERYAHKIIAPLVLGYFWLGVFFTTSTRFLVGTYLRTGNMKGVAEKCVRRAPRLIIPIAAVALFEYFIIDVGGTKWLMYLPSITWSDWPFVTSYTTFGEYLSEVLELLFLIPNAVPQITFNYCTGVLWTIPVQLQGTWTILLAGIVVREIKTPWKRFSYYGFVVLCHYYARSWGSLMWLGVMLTDLDITYKYKKFLNDRPVALYACIAGACFLAACGNVVEYVASNTGIQFSTWEAGIHPEPTTGLPLVQVPDSPLAGYPPYYVPKLNCIIFAFGLTSLVELSTNVQKILSMRIFIIIFPHIFTIYLIHGLVLWSLGSFVCVHLAAANVPYWANMLITAMCCYGTIFGCLPIVTPIIELLGKVITDQIWLFASRKPAVRRATLYPFPEDLIQEGNEDKNKEVEGGFDADVEKKAAQKEMNMF